MGLADKQKLQQLAKRLGHKFRHIELLDHALCHRSVGASNNERLEFLGDAVLGLLVSVDLYCRYQDATEGDLSRMRSSLVNGETLAQIAHDFHLGEYLHLGQGERKSGGEQRTSILADAMEAIIGAIYMDAGLEVASNRVLAWYGEMVEDLSNLKVVKDAKSQLQERLQFQKMPLPTYAVSKSGKAHELTFTVVCRVKGLPYETSGTSSSRRKAEQIAAELFLERLNEH